MEVSGILALSPEDAFSTIFSYMTAAISTAPHHHLAVGEKVFPTDLPLQETGTDMDTLKLQISIYWYGSYAILIALAFITIYTILGFTNKFLVQDQQIDILGWLHRYN